jgi:hypothetical protein
LASDRKLIVRRAFLFGTPLLYLALGVIHPMEDPGPGDAAGVFVVLHVVQLFLIGAVGYSIWLLVEGIENRAATVARALILPYVILYTAFDSIVGIATGTAIREANELPAADQAATGRLIDALQEADPAGYVLYVATGLSFLAAILAVVVALRDRASWQPLVLMIVGALVFAVGHPKPTGPIGMGLLLAGIVWLELRPRRAEVQEAVPAS